MGGEWVGPSTFLLYETLEHGPLLLETTGAVRSVLSDLLGIRSVPSILGPEAYGWIARPSIDTATGSFHLLLSGVGEEARFPLAVLYHAEDGSQETLPYRHPWSDEFAPDGRWLLMDARPDDAGYEAHQVWIRPLEAADGDWTLLADRLDSDLWSLDMASYAWQHGSMVGWRTFPTGDLLGEWNTAPYAARPAMISPDGCRLAAEGNYPRRPALRSVRLGSLFRVARLPTQPQLDVGAASRFRADDARRQLDQPSRGHHLGLPALPTTHPHDTLPLIPRHAQQELQRTAIHPGGGPVPRLALDWTDLLHFAHHLAQRLEAAHEFHGLPVTPA